MNSKSKKYLMLFIIILITEFIIGKYVHDRFIRPYAGDILIIILIYCFIRIFKPEGLDKLHLYVFIFAIFVEVGQYFNMVKILNLENYKLARIILGTVFDIKDIICYFIVFLIIDISLKLD